MDAGEIIVAQPSPRLYKSLTFRRIATKERTVPQDEEMKIRSPRFQDESLTAPFILDKKARSKAPAVVLGFECLESTAFNGIATNLVVYLETLLHGSNLASASNVTTWFGTSYLTPVFGAIIADTFWGNYNTILVSLVFYLLMAQSTAATPVTTSFLSFFPKAEIQELNKWLLSETGLRSRAQDIMFQISLAIEQSKKRC